MSEVIENLEPLSFWGRTKSIKFWGKRSGMVLRENNTVAYAFKTKKWANGSNNSGPCGWKARNAKRGRI
jgi:hypothetical protein